MIRELNSSHSLVGTANDLPTILDSMDKLVTSHIAAVTSQPIKFKKFEIKPQPLVASPLLFRGFTCPPNCGGCCFRVTLDFLPTEPRPENTRERFIEINGRPIRIFSDLQDDHDSKYCKNRDEIGRCRIHRLAGGTGQPFLCDFELIRIHLTQHDKPNRMLQQLFTRGWRLEQISGPKGAACEMLPPDEYTVSEVVRKLKRLKDWTDHFRLSTCLDSMIEWAEDGPHTEPKVFNQEFSSDEQRSIFSITRRS